MRFIDRKRFSPPALLLSAEVEERRRVLHSYLSGSSIVSAQSRAPIDYRLLESSELSEALREVFRYGCAYCEAQLTGIGLPHATHTHRPLGFAEDTDGRTHMMHYVWLAYEWDNMLRVCSPCRSRKQNRFFVEGPRGIEGATINALRSEERALLLDPCFDDPAEHLAFFPNGRVEGLTARGKASIELLGLTSKDLRLRRRAAFTSAASLLVHATGTLIAVETGAPGAWSGHVIKGVPHAGATSLAVLRNMSEQGLPAIDLPSLLRHLENLTLEERRNCFAAFTSGFVPEIDGDEELAPLPAESVQRSRTRRLSEMPLARTPITSVTIKNFKALKDIALTLPEMVGSGASTPCMIILGENATGKSSVLEAISLALLGAQEVAALDRILTDQSIRPADFIHRPDLPLWAASWKEPLSVEIGYLSSSHRTLLKGVLGAQTFVGSDEQSRIVLAYGPRRLFATRKTRRFRASAYRARSLFDPMAIITNPAQWLASCPPMVFDAVARALREVLMLGPNDQFERHEGQVTVQKTGVRTRLDDMSVGYKSMIAMTTDIMRELMHHYDNLEYASATILIDEIETHLHPRWKMRIMGCLRRALPQVQFIVTTHDPLCLRGMHDGEVFVLVRSEKDQSIQQLKDLPSIRGMRAEQILTSELFGLGSTDPETEAKLLVYHNLVARAEHLSEAERAELDRLREELQKDMAVGDTLLEQIVAEIFKKTELESRVVPQRAGSPSRRLIIDSALEALKTEPTLGGLTSAALFSSVRLTGILPPEGGGSSGAQG